MDEWTWPRKHGRAIIQRVIIDAELREGGHVHTANYGASETCQGGDPECSLWAQQLNEAMEAWAT